jgi:NAD(P)-dependent dehydrogenase (short-subunit alcohol dehydrogenase family)
MAKPSIRKPANMSPEHLSTRPGKEAKMKLKPRFEAPKYQGSGKLKGRVAIITGGDSGIGRAIAVAFAKEEANVTISYLKEDTDARETKKHVEEIGSKCILIRGDVGDEKVCQKIVDKTLKEMGRIDIVINNAGEQHPQESLEKIDSKQLERTFRTNIFAMFYLTKAALPHLKKGSSIINTASVTAYKGNPTLLDYSSTKGAIIAFTRSLSLSLAAKGIRVNAVAPGPIWTPLIPSTFPKNKVESFGKDTPMQRPGQPEEVAPAYVYLASGDSSYVTGQTIHVNGGSVVNA